jgi:hypothetical protein
LIQALGIDPSRHDRDLLWSLVRHLEAELEDGGVGELARELVRDPAVDQVIT